MGLVDPAGKTQLLCEGTTVDVSRLTVEVAGFQGYQTFDPMVESGCHCYIYVNAKEGKNIHAK